MIALVRIWYRGEDEKDAFLVLFLLKTNFLIGFCVERNSYILVWWAATSHVSVATTSPHQVESWQIWLLTRETVEAGWCYWCAPAMEMSQRGRNTRTITEFSKHEPLSLTKGEGAWLRRSSSCEREELNFKMQQHLPALSRTSGRQTFLLQKRHFCWILCKSSSSSVIMIIIIIIDIWSQLMSGTNGTLWRHWGERRWKQCKNCECCPVSLLILNS